MIGVTIRPAREPDAAPVFNLFQRWSGHEKQDLLYGFNNWHTHLVAELEGEVIGYAAVTPDQWDAAFYPATRAMGTNWGFLADLLVREGYRSRGVGGRLLVAAEDVARRAGAQGLAINPDATGERDRLCRFYESYGFIPVWPRGEAQAGDVPYYFLRF
ncbi:GNAT family N-acetyltransferase [Brachybacterium paraconglomeratum]|uniref:GNAT family N-acetyltransferase n=1 Tax=Brachybacterium paraconglomeratum TaxID=173362 RepID=UPI0021A5B928|nr:GNAT family N-acetyltransferase [Brachybacterium paraconglomeratum]MCT1909663.1 GNAT family N-acetyltransferase [Brachybacterium paraconglomeratum]